MKAKRIEKGHYEYKGYTVERVYHIGQGNTFYIKKDDKTINVLWPNRDCQPSFKEAFKDIDYMTKVK